MNGQHTARSLTVLARVKEMFDSIEASDMLVLV